MANLERVEPLAESGRRVVFGGDRIAVQVAVGGHRRRHRFSGLEPPARLLLVRHRSVGRRLGRRVRLALRLPKKE